MERTVICYHGNCPDGFGGAYAAWKKFGDSAEYRPLSYGKPVPTDLAGAHLYFIDFCYELPVMEKIRDEAASLTVLDHHEGTRPVVEAMPEFVYDKDRSGAVIAWSYFHPEEAVPSLLLYVQDGDLYQFKLPDTHAILTYVYAQPFDFATWDVLRSALEREDDEGRIILTGKSYREYYEILLGQIANSAELVQFEGRAVYLVSAPRAFISDVGNRLAEAQPPFALVTSARPDGVRVSLRGNGSVDLAKLAQKYGGNGHPKASAFFLPWGTPIPWSLIPTDEYSGD